MEVSASPRSTYEKKEKYIKNPQLNGNGLDTFLKRGFVDNAHSGLAR